MRTFLVPTAVGLALAVLAAPLSGLAQAPPPPPPAPAVPLPPPMPPPPPPPAEPEWTPPSDSAKGGEGNLKDAPLFQPSGELRRFTLTWNPLTLFLNRGEIALEILMTDHHALQITGFFGATRTNEVYPSAGDTSHEHAFTTLFMGGGGELGYRWYSGMAGPRGLYVAPSFLLAEYVATPTQGAGTKDARDGQSIPFTNLGGALDVGWQGIFADRWVAGIGAGLQYTVPTHTFPQQELPASVYAIRGLRPRLLLTLGVAF